VTTADLLQALQAMSPWELAAVLLGIAYLLLAMREHLWCWYAAFASTAIFLFLFWDVNLLMESALQADDIQLGVARPPAGHRGGRGGLLDQRAGTAAIQHGCPAFPRLLHDLGRRVDHLDGGAQNS
jgi:hypothetical protein